MFIAIGFDTPARSARRASVSALGPSERTISKAVANS
jgi:hypothetical protein